MKLNRIVASLHVYCICFISIASASSTLIESTESKSQSITNQRPSKVIDSQSHSTIHIQSTPTNHLRNAQHDSNDALELSSSSSSSSSSIPSLSFSRRKLSSWSIFLNLCKSGRRKQSIEGL